MINFDPLHHFKVLPAAYRQLFWPILFRSLFALYFLVDPLTISLPCLLRPLDKLQHWIKPLLGLQCTCIDSLIIVGCLTAMWHHHHSIGCWQNWWDVGLFSAMKWRALSPPQLWFDPTYSIIILSLSAHLIFTWLPVCFWVENMQGLLILKLEPEEQSQRNELWGGIIDLTWNLFAKKKTPIFS